MIVMDTAIYSHIIFGLLTLPGFTYAPKLADLSDWRTARCSGCCTRTVRAARQSVVGGVRPSGRSPQPWRNRGT